MKKLLKIGHRGAMGHEPENTIASIEKAMELKVDLIEIDIFQLKSDDLVVFHDETLERLTNGTGKIEDLTWEEVQKITILGQHKIPKLKEVIEKINRSVPLNIELKGKNTVKSLFDLLENYYQKGWKETDFLLSSFNWDELETYRKLDNQIPMAVLTKEDPLDTIDFAKKIKAVAINPYWKTITTENCKILQNNGFKIYTYTVNEPNDIKFVTELGVDGIFCNFPERLQNV
jgi:glycerophosphoryl diester phosphodiesterase